MRNIEKYYNNTESEKPRNNVKYFNDEIKCNQGKAIELGCEAGNDTVYLIKNNWNVITIDREDVEEDESNDDVAYRELFEETGIYRSDIELDHFIDLNYFKYENNIQVYYGILKHKVNLIEEKINSNG